MEPDNRDELEYILKPVAVRLRNRLPSCEVGLDRGDIDDPERPFEVFDIFFAMPAGCDGSINPKTIDGRLMCWTLIDQVSEAIQKRFEQLLPGFNGYIGGIGISYQTSWRFGRDVIEGEAMLGDLWDPGAEFVQFSFAARFIAPVDQITARCRNAPRIDSF